MSETIGLWTLFGSSFLAATLLPGGSEAVLFGLLKLQPAQLWPALVVATVGNTLGGMSSYLIGRLLPQRIDETRYAQPMARVRRHGSIILLLSWVPLVGDPLCVAAGWLRVNAWAAAVYMAIGKFARYTAVAFFAA